MQVIVDAENRVQELNEDNNIIYVNFTIPAPCDVVYHFARIQQDYEVQVIVYINITTGLYEC